MPENIVENIVENIITMHLVVLGFLAIIFILACFDFFAEKVRPKDEREQSAILWSVIIAWVPFMILFATFINPQPIAKYVIENITAQSIWLWALLTWLVLIFTCFRASKQKQSALKFVIRITWMMFVYYLTALSAQ